MDSIKALAQMVASTDQAFLASSALNAAVLQLLLDKGVFTVEEFEREHLRQKATVQAAIAEGERQAEEEYHRLLKKQSNRCC